FHWDEEVNTNPKPKAPKDQGGRGSSRAETLFGHKSDKRLRDRLQIELFKVSKVLEGRRERIQSRARKKDYSCPVHAACV
ncbi:hypothetical protein QQP08_018495, partial [Theobroma cacao]